MKLTSVLLAGGQNKRMNGIPKWNLQFGKETMIERSIGQLSLISDNILIVTGGNYQISIPEIEGTKVSILYDKTPYLGPLNGILTALIKSNDTYNFIVAADMPFFSTVLAQYMYKTAIENKSNLVIPVWNNNLQPLHGIYNKDVILSILKDLENNKLSLIKWISSQDKVYYLEEKMIKKVINDPKIFFNMNYPYEYEQALTLINKETNRSE